MSRRHPQRNHHRPHVAKRRRRPCPWVVTCDCGDRCTCPDWHTALVRALAHSQELTS